MNIGLFNQHSNGDRFREEREINEGRRVSLGKTRFKVVYRGFDINGKEYPNDTPVIFSWGGSPDYSVGSTPDPKFKRHRVIGKTKKISKKEKESIDRRVAEEEVQAFRNNDDEKKKGFFHIEEPRVLMEETSDPGFENLLGHIAKSWEAVNSDLDDEKGENDETGIK